jgi:hypothetical protein
MMRVLFVVMRGIVCGDEGIVCGDEGIVYCLYSNLKK